MFDEEMYDSMLDELKSITKSMKEIKELISQQISVENKKYILLQKILEGQNQTTFLDEKINLDLNKYADKNLLIINSSSRLSFNIAKKITTNIKGKFVKSEAKTDNELVNFINSLSDGDVVFIDVSEPTFNNKMGKIIYDCVKNKYINISIGNGVETRSIHLDIPEVTFIVFAYLEDFLPEGLKDYLLQVEFF